jgi:hypothetical protein
MAFRRPVLEAVGGFRVGRGRSGRVPRGCEETELCLRIRARVPGARVVYDPAAVVRHRVPAARGRWRYFAARCFGEGISKAAVVRLAGSGPGLSAERRHAVRTLPAGVAAALRDGALTRAAAIVAGLAITILGYARGRVARGVRPVCAPPPAAARPGPTGRAATPRPARPASRPGRSAARARSGRHGAS